MFSNQDACEVGGLEVIFRSHQFGRGTDAAEGREISDLGGREDVIFAKEFGRPLTAVPLHDVEDEAERGLSPGGGRLEAPGMDETEVLGAPVAGRSLRGRCGVGRGARRCAIDGAAETTHHALLDDRFRRRAGCAGGRGNHGRSESASAVECLGTRKARHGASGRRVPHPPCGVNGLDGSGRIAHGRGRTRWPVIGHGHEHEYGRGARFGQLARGTRDPRWARDLHRHSGLARGVR